MGKVVTLELTLTNIPEKARDDLLGEQVRMLMLEAFADNVGVNIRLVGPAPAPAPVPAPATPPGETSNANGDAHDDPK